MRLWNLSILPDLLTHRKLGQVAVTERAAAADAAPAVAENPKVALVAVKTPHPKVGLDQVHNNNDSSSSARILPAQDACQGMVPMMQITAMPRNTVSSTTTSVIGLMNAETHHLRGRVIFVVMLKI